MKQGIIFLLFILTPCYVFSQKVTAFEFEMAIGSNFGVENKSGADIREGVDIVLELRHNYNRRFDFGLQFLLGAYDLLDHARDKEITWRNLMLQPVVDYNFRQGKKVNPFAGAGLGLAVIDMDYGHDSEKSLCFTPRVGAEFFRHLRLTVRYNLLKQDFSFWNATIGVVFGGGKKRT